MSERPTALSEPPEGYAEWLASLKDRIHSAQQRAALAVNTELLRLYWEIGNDILQRQAERGWGAKVIDRPSHDLREAFPETKGFSPRNLKYMRAFAQAWLDAGFVQEVLARLPRYHHIALLEKLEGSDERRRCAEQASEPHGAIVQQVVGQLQAGHGIASRKGCRL